MALHLDLFEDAHSALRSGELMVSSMTFQEAARQAELIGDHSNWFKSTVWAADIEVMLGRYPLAQSLVIDAVTRIDEGESGDRWGLYKLKFKIAWGWLPEKERLEEALEELQREQRRLVSAPHDVSFYRMLLADRSGNWLAALEWGEEAFRVHESLRGIMKSAVAFRCAAVSVKLGRYPAAEEWIRAIKVKDEWDSGWDKFIVAWQVGFPRFSGQSSV